MRVWNQPASQQLESRLVEQLASSPWRLITNRPPSATPPVASLNTMLQHALNEESFLEVRQTDHREQWTFVVKLDKPRLAVWNRELASVLSSLEGNYPTHRPGGWSLRGQSSGRLYEVAITGPWFVLGISQDTNALFQELKLRLERERAPFRMTTNTHWLSLDADLHWLAQKFRGPGPGGTGQASESPRITLMISGDGANTITTGEIKFSQPLALNLEPWKFPKVPGPVAGFSALRGVSSWLEGTDAWGVPEFGPAPNQIFTWADAHAPLQMYLAAPAPESGELITKLAPKASAWLAEYAVGSIATWPGGGGFIWKDLPMIAPYLRLTPGSDGAFLEAGLVPQPEPPTNAAPGVRPSVSDLTSWITSQTNLVAYEWEMTGARAESFHFLGQILRLGTRRPQIPADTATSTWLQNVRQRLGNTTTSVVLAAPNTLKFKRRSSVGFNAFELHVVADWMESPEFPRGFYSTLSPVELSPPPGGK